MRVTSCRAAALLTASLVARLSLGVSSDCEPAAQPAAPRGGSSWSSAPLFSVRCLVTMSWRQTQEGGEERGERR